MVCSSSGEWSWVVASCALYLVEHELGHFCVLFMETLPKSILLEGG